MQCSRSRTQTGLLHAAADRGMVLKIWFIALDSANRHIERVRKRVSRGGHAVSDELVRARYDASRANPASRMSRAAAVKVYDNSYEASIERGEVPRPRLVLDFAAGRIVNDEDLSRTPGWAKPLVVAALKASKGSR